MAAAAATGIGVSCSSKLITNIERHRWMVSPLARSSTSKTIKMAAVPLSFDVKTKRFTLQKSEDAFKKTKENFNIFTRRKARRGLRMTQWKAYCATGISVQPVIEMSASEFTKLGEPYYGHGIAEIATSSTTEMSNAASAVVQNVQLIDLDPATAKTLIPFLGPFLSAFAFLFILRIVMSWYPKLPVEKFPYIIPYAPTEPLLIPTRKLIPPLGGVDVTPVVWFGLISFLNEILVGPQGLLVLLSQKI